MELISTDSHFILIDGEHSLWINRQTSVAYAKIGCNCDIAGATCLGVVYGYLGKVHFGDAFESRLIFIRQRSLVGYLDGCEIYKILSVLSVPLESDVELILEACVKHAPHTSVDPSFVPVAQGDGKISGPSTYEYTGQKNLFKVMSKSASGFHDPSFGQSKRSEKIDKVERRILEEFHKMFTDADSFYYSLKYDLTNSVQRQFLNSERNAGLQPIWYSADNRFIWNYHMINDLINSKDANMDKWIIPMIQGYAECSICELDQRNDSSSKCPDLITGNGHLQLWVISRRSRYRAGTRYLRRGIDENGKVANYVETEQIMIFQNHKTSFVQIRGSIPLFWSQPGQRYRPAPRLDKTEEESYSAFRVHFKEEGSIYGPITIINLVDKSGKEKILGDAYLSSVLTHNSPDLVYLSFDFHEQCRGMRFENVSILIEKLDDIFNSMSYCWVDPYGLVLKQKGTIRVNCVDCLDRTNVVQTHIGKHALQTQLSKLGLFAPEVGLAKNIKSSLQTLWANNGDTISKQYAGTNALKGDFTRTGERKFTGALKDGMNSASRYYLNRFRDTYRQAAIDITLGERNNLPVDELDEAKPADEKENTVEQIKNVIEDTKKCVIPKHAVILGAWGLVNAKENGPDEIDIDTIFIITDTNYYTSEYDCDLDSITETEMVNLQAVSSVELGFEKLTQPSAFWSLFGHPNQTNSSALSKVPCLRINYTHGGESHCHEFRSSNIRFFNNVAVPIQFPEEMLEALRMIAEAVQIATSAIDNKIEFRQTDVLPPRPVPKTPITSLPSTWVRRYFHFVPEQDPDIGLKKQTTRTSALSFDRFTPKYFRRSSGANMDETGELITKINSKMIGLQESETFKKSIELGANTNIKVPVQSPMLISESQLQSQLSPLLIEAADLVLPSCGVVAFSPSRNSSVNTVGYKASTKLPSSLSSFLPIAKTNEAEISNTPITPTYPIYGNTLEIDEYIPSSSALSKHRLSLPVNSVSAGQFRSVTPEIKITGTTSSILTPVGEVEKSLGVPLISKRMSRSTEEIPIDSAKTNDRNFSTGNSGLSPIFTKENRSSSTQNICNSSLNMKASRSDNAILGRTNSARNTTINPLSKESVLVPLGKLARGMQKGANYFDPRKLKSTFKPQIKREFQGITETFQKEDREYLRQLEDRKRNCRSLIIEL